MSQEERMSVADRRAAKKLEKANKRAADAVRRSAAKTNTGASIAGLPFMGDKTKATVTVEPLLPSSVAKLPANTATPVPLVDRYDRNREPPGEGWTWAAGFNMPTAGGTYGEWMPGQWLKPGMASSRPAYGGGYRSSYARPTTPVDKKARVVADPAGTTTGYPRVAQDELLKDKSVMKLLEMLTYKRPEASETEEAFIQKYIVDLPHVTRDGYGNRWVRVNKADGSEPDILFSCHTDTVHHAAGMQQISVGDGRAFTEDGNCLGADDAAGVWLCIEMIEAKVPGLYIFHRAEEHGGKGSAYIAKSHAPKLKTIKAAIAFDRKDYGDVITYQAGGVCASQAFAKSLACMLGGNFKPCASGVFTDTANYTHLIGECSNISVGYHNAHGPMEWLDLAFLTNLRDRLIVAEWDRLECSRKAEPKVTRSVYGSAGYGGPTRYVSKPKNVKPTIHASDVLNDRRKTLAEAFGEAARNQAANMLAYCQLYPDTVAHFLLAMDYDVGNISKWYKDLAASKVRDWDPEDEEDDTPEEEHAFDNKDYAGDWWAGL